MRTTIPTLGAISWGRRPMPAAVALGLLLVLGSAQTTTAQSGSAQSDGPLNFGNNFFVTGDYVVAGAYGLGVNAPAANGFATGTITIPDANPGITGTKSVPAGAQIVAALFYWQTVEKSNQLGTGQNGFFRPLFKVPPPGGQPAPYPITGVNLNGQNTVSFSGGGCTGSSTGGKVVRTYRADVRSFLPRDASGNVLVNSTDVTFEVGLPSNPNATLPTLGATLVLIYRVISPNFPLNSIVIYDGAFAPGNISYTMTQTVRGFYQADKTPVSRLTHIVGNGHSYKFQTVFLGPTPTTLTALPPLYGSGQPFPGYYGSWDNTTWTFPDPNYPKIGNPVQENNASATTMVVPSSSQGGCVSWGAVIVSTTVHDDDKDGILKVWKQNQGYTDVGTGQFVSLADSTDPVEPGLPRQDVFIQLDHVVDSIETEDFTPKPGVESLVKTAFLTNNHNIHLHITDKNTIQETACNDASLTPPQLCPYPNQPGITTWPDGFEFLKNQLVNSSGSVCTLPAAPSCVPRFPIAQRNSHHYVVFGDALGAANWGLLGGTLMDTTGTGAGGGVVVQSGNTGTNAGTMVTFNTSTAHGLKVDHGSGNGRVTITGAISNPSLNGTYWVASVNCKTNPETHMSNDCSVSNKAAGPYTFTIDIGGNNPKYFNYTRFTDPNLAVASGLAGTGSGFSYVGGSGTLVTLGLWKEKNNVRSQSGTFMHELGHTLGLQHGGGDSTNCKSNYQSVMNYMFQTALLGPNGAVDFSSQQLSDLDETNLGPITTTDPQIAFSTTSWYDTQQTFVSATITSFAIASNVVTFQAANGFAPGDMVKIAGLTIGTYLNGQVLTVIATGLSGTQFEANFTNANVLSTADSGTAVKALGSAATHHCDGTPLSIADLPTYFYQGGTQTLSQLEIPWPITRRGDVDFDGKTPGSEGLFHGYDDWANTDFRQVGATGSVLLGPGGLFTGPGGLFTGPGGLFTGPGGLFTGPGASGGEIDLATAISVVHAPGTLTATEDRSPRVIHLSWTAPTFVDSFNIYRSSNNGAPGTFSFLTSVSGTTTTYTDPVTCNPNGYKYFVTVVLQNTTLTPPQNQESTPSNTAPSSDPRLTGCYTNTPNVFPTPALSDLAFTDLSSANTPVQGDTIQVTWSLKTDDTGVFVQRTAANTALLAIGPIPSNGQCAQLPKPPAVLGFNGTYPYRVANLSAGIGPSGNQFAVNWDTTNFNAGCYFFELDTESNQSETSAALTLLIFVSDSNPHITTTTLPNATAGVLYSNTVFESGGTVNNTTAFQWTIVPNSVTLNGFSVPSIGGISFQPNAIGITNGTLSGTATTVGTYIFTAKVTDSVGNTGMRALMLTVVAPVAQVNQPVAPENARPSASGFTLTVNGTGFYAGSSVLWNGSARATTFNNVNQLTATIPSADVAGFGTASISVANTGSPTSNVDFFQITNPTTGVSLGRVDYATGAAPGGLITGDFNGDGKLDLATANTTSNTVSVLLGNGDGTFAAASTFAVGSDPFNLVAGDFNNDGKLDLAVANFAGGATSNISILLGNGDGTFQTPGPTFAAGKGPISVVTGDFNRDGKLDLAVANRLDNTVSILLGNGDGTFQPHADYVASTQDVAGLAVGDFNGDGKLDLAVTNPSTGQVSILLGNGDGTFQAPVAYSTGASGDHPTAVTVADFNGDGILDLAVTKFNAKNVAIFLGKGDGTFQPEVSYATTSGAMVGPGGITTGDFNGDGLVDLVVTDQYDNTVSILLGNGNGTFQGPLEFATGNLSAGVAAGDFNGDGRLDVAVANDGASTVSVMLQPQVLLVPSALPFGSVAEGASTPSAVSLTNNGPGALTINSFAFGGTNPGDFSQTNYCPTSPSTLAGGLTCTITVTFAPTATGARSGTLIVTYPGTGSPQTVNLSGSGFVAAPANLTANAVAGSGSVSLAWSASPSASGGYNVYRSTTSGAYTSANKIASGVATTSYTDTVATGTTYYYVVTAVDGSGNESAFSNEASATP